MRELCWAENTSAGGVTYRCTLQKKHEGQHVCDTTIGETPVLWKWSDERTSTDEERLIVDKICDWLDSIANDGREGFQ